MHNALTSAQNIKNMHQNSIIYKQNVVKYIYKNDTYSMLVNNNDKKGVSIIPGGTGKTCRKNSGSNGCASSRALQSSHHRILAHNPHLWKGEREGGER